MFQRLGWQKISEIEMLGVKMVYNPVFGTHTAFCMYVCMYVTNQSKVKNVFLATQVANAVITYYSAGRPSFCASTPVVYTVCDCTA